MRCTPQKSSSSLGVRLGRNVRYTTKGVRASVSRDVELFVSLLAAASWAMALAELVFCR